MKIRILYIFLVISQINSAQNSLKELLATYNDETIPYISVQKLKSIQTKVVLLDAREKKEFDVSHIKNAIYVGYDHFDINDITNLNLSKESTIVVYCSLGVRSEDISKKLKKVGYHKIYNLYGGIFEWKNNDNQIINNKGETTEEVHIYSKQWEKWLHKGKKVH
ncbi:rhodanese-like domain-containing protein [Aquimarina sp. 2201CG5-10]|uniref:rhodanese-like domain-containing protein n=1 Tax=Aquimarina callyspongiae TaxID=3098150 RepID=UPI002AB3AEE8|nr:rhodanese-like domain-containing protein [Aquimarina sp. 2201CG5-10]MDY8134758.1 rhodanese-like domain-containing protein [Aquimarina sp. 2201CG5-10]